MEARYVLSTLNDKGYYQHNYFDSITEINRVIKEYNLKKYQIYDIEQDCIIKTTEGKHHGKFKNFQSK